MPTTTHFSSEFILDPAVFSVMVAASPELSLLNLRGE
jgi:hypothetical protein